MYRAQQSVWKQLLIGVIASVLASVLLSLCTRPQSVRFDVEVEVKSPQLPAAVPLVNIQVAQLTNVWVSWHFLAFTSLLDSVLIPLWCHLQQFLDRGHRYTFWIPLREHFVDAR